MAKRNPFGQIRLVYRRSPLFLKILVLGTLLVSIAALLALRSLTAGYRQQGEALQTQAIALQQENAALTEYIAELGSEASIRRIAMDELGLMDPSVQFFHPGQ